MFLKQKKCQKCGYEFDELSRECPNCKSKNDITNLKGFKKCKALFVTPFHQLIIFLFGWLGFQLIGGLIQIIIIQVNKNKFETNEELINFMQSPKINGLLTYTTYVVLFVGLILILIPFLKQILNEFKSIKKIFIGIGTGFIIILLSFLYGILSELIYPNLPTNENQNILESMIPIFPLSSIIILGLIGPMCEEITYRLGLFSLLRRKNKYLAYAITIIIFTLIHFGWSCLIPFDKEKFVIELINLPSYFLGAFCLSFVYEKFGFSTSFYAHATNNLFSVVMILIGKALSNG